MSTGPTFSSLNEFTSIKSFVVLSVIEGDDPMCLVYFFFLIKINFPVDNLFLTDTNFIGPFSLIFNFGLSLGLDLRFYVK